MNPMPIAQLPQHVMTGLMIVLGHVLALFFIGLICVAVWVRVVAPVFGLSNQVIHIDGRLIVTAVLAYAALIVAHGRRDRTE